MEKGNICVNNSCKARQLESDLWVMNGSFGSFCTEIGFVARGKDPHIAGNRCLFTTGGECLCKQTGGGGGRLWKRAWLASPLKHRTLHSYVTIKFRKNKSIEWYTRLKTEWANKCCVSFFFFFRRCAMDSLASRQPWHSTSSSRLLRWPPSKDRCVCKLSFFSGIFMWPREFLHTECMIKILLAEPI